MERLPNSLNTLSKAKIAVAATTAGVALLSTGCEASSSGSGSANSSEQESEYDVEKSLTCNGTSASIRLSVSQEALVKVLNGGTQGLEIDKKDNKAHYLDKHQNGVDQEDDIKLNNGSSETIFVSTTRFRISENQGEVVVRALCNKNSLDNPNKDKTKTKEPKTDLNKDINKNTKDNSRSRSK